MSKNGKYILTANDDTTVLLQLTLLGTDSNSSRASHVKHTQGRGSPDGNGKSLIGEAVHEFRKSDTNECAQTRGMTMKHFVAVSNAAA